MSEKLIAAIADMDETKALTLTKEILTDEASALAVLDDCRVAMDIVGKRFEEGEYYISELILAGEILKDISAEVKPLLSDDDNADKKAKVMVATVKGDIHDIGKDIVVFMLEINGFDVNDMGIDVPKENIIESIKTYQPDILALSGFLTLSYDSMKETVTAIEEAGLRDGLKIMVGGGTIDQKICDHAKADAFGKDAMAAVALADQWA